MVGKEFNYSLKILENHLDTFGHVNNATYLTLLEEARWDLLTKNGYGLKKILATGLSPIIIEINIKFLKEVLLRDDITIYTQLVSYQNKIAKLKQKVMRGSEICTEAEITFGLFDIGKRKLVLPTAEWLHAIGGNEKIAKNS